MTWETFYLICFFFGLVMTVFSFTLGMLGSLHIHLPHGHFHMPHIGGHGVPKMGVGHGHGPAVKAGVGTKAGAVHGTGIHWFNYFTVMAFLTCFGASGYIFTRHGLLGAVVISLSSFFGLLGAAVIFGFFVKVLLPHDKLLDPADFEMVGVIGRVSMPIRTEGTGEIIYSQDGTRRCCGARSETGVAIPKQTEVVVTRYEKGIAYVQKWEEFSGEGKVELGEERPEDRERRAINKDWEAQ